MCRLGRHRRAELPQHREVVEYPDAAAIRADDQVVVMDGDVTYDRGGQVEHQRLPIVAIVERDVRGTPRAGEQETAPLWVRSHDTHWRAGGLRCRQPCNDPCPRLPIVPRAVDVWSEVAAI